MGAIAQREPANELVAQIRRPDFQEQIQIALPNGVGADRFVRATVTALMQNPELVEADRSSLLQSVLKCAQDGLLPDGREAALVIFNTKVKTSQGEQWVKKAQYLPMVGGLRKIAGEHGWTLQTAVVYANDDFDFELGLEPRLTHRPVRPGADRGEKVAAYAVAKRRDGSREFEVMTAADIDRVRQSSRAKDYGPWKDWPERMWEKTVGRRLFAKLPMGVRDADRIGRLINELEPGESTRMLYGAAVRTIEASPALPAESGGAADGAAAADSQAAGDATKEASPAAPLDDAVDDSDAPGPTVIDAEAVEETDPAWRALADVAAGYRPAGKKWPKEMTLAEIHQQPDGADYIAWAARDPRAGKLLQAAALDYTRVYLPAAYQAATGGAS